MGGEEFINRPMSLALDIVRVIAAMAVLLGHSVQLGIYTGHYPFKETMQHLAVIAFFVLSGLVIQHSVQVRQMPLAEYAAARIARIMPIAIVAIGVSFALFLVTENLNLNHWTPPQGEEQLSWKNVLLPVIFMSEATFGDGLIWNPPYWSLCNEAWYYALFGAAVFTSGRARWISLALLAVCAGPRILVLMPVWLTGAAVVRYRIGTGIGPKMGGLIASIAWLSIPLAVATVSLTRSLAVSVVPEAIGLSSYFPSIWLIGLAFAALFIGLRPIAGDLAPWLERNSAKIRDAAAMTFPLYLLHWPLLSCLRSLGFTVGGNVAGLMLVMGGMVAVAIVVARISSRYEQTLRNRLVQIFEGSKQTQVA